MATIDELRARAELIAEEQQIGGNTAERVGDAFDMVADIIEAVAPGDQQSVLYNPQSPNEAQKAQARENIGAQETISDIADFVKVSAQTFTAAQKQQARENIGAEQAGGAVKNLAGSASDTETLIKAANNPNLQANVHLSGNNIYVNGIAGVVDLDNNGVNIKAGNSGYPDAKVKVNGQEVATKLYVDGKIDDRADPIELALDIIEAVIPSQASAQNQLADKAFVNSSISSSTANFVGTFDSLPELQAVQNPTNNDYGFVIETDAVGNEYYDRYKYNGTDWLFEYKVESTPFTAAQWAAIQSGITSALVGKLSALPTNAELTTSLNAKADKSDTYTKAQVDASISAIDVSSQISGKADKVANAVAGDFAALDASGNLVDSGKKASDFATAAQGAKADSALQRGDMATINGSDITHGGNVTIVAAEGQTITIDAAPTEGSDNAVSSGGVFNLQKRLFGTETAIIASQATIPGNAKGTYYPIGMTLTAGQTYRIRIISSGWLNDTGSSYCYIYTCKGSAVTSGGGVDNLVPLLDNNHFNVAHTLDYTPTIAAKYIYIGTLSGYQPTGNESVTIEVIEQTEYDNIEQITTNKDDIAELKDAVYGDGLRTVSDVTIKGKRTFYPLGIMLEVGKTYQITLTTRGWAQTNLAYIQATTINSGYGVNLPFPSNATNQTHTIDYTPTTPYLRWLGVYTFSNYVETGDEEVTVIVKEHYNEDDDMQGCALTAQATLAQGESVELPINFAQQNSLHSANIGAFTDVKFGWMSDYFGAFYVEVDASSVKIWAYSTSTWALAREYQHGLAIGTNNTISILQTNHLTAKVIMSCEGVIYETPEFAANGGGTIKCENVGQTSINVYMASCALDIMKDVWIVGDSYLSYGENRWEYYLINNGYTKFLRIQLSGGGGANLLPSLYTLLKLRAPKIVIWCSGMNDGSDVDGEPNYIWLSYIQSLLTLSNAYKFTPILYTVPTIPSINNEAKNVWIKASGYRYMDAAKALGATPSGSWYDGMRDSDNIHTSVLGAKALYQQAMVDVPELFTNG